MTTLTLPTGSVNANIVNANRHGLRAPKGGCKVGGRFFPGGCFCLPWDPTNPLEEAARVEPSTLAIAGFTYEVRPIEVAPECGSVAFHLHKTATNNTYAVILASDGVARCDCPDYIWRHEGHGTACKHIRAVVAAGLIKINPVILPPSQPAPAPVAGLASDDESCVDLSGFASRMGREDDQEVVYHGVRGRWVPITPQASVFKPTVRDRIEYPAPRSRRYEPSAEEAAEAAQLFADLASDRAESYRRDFAAVC